MGFPDCSCSGHPALPLWAPGHSLSAGGRGCGQRKGHPAHLSDSAGWWWPPEEPTSFQGISYITFLIPPTSSRGRYDSSTAS